MTTSEFLENLLHLKKESRKLTIIDEAAAFEAAQLVCGSFVYPLYGTLWQYYFDMEAITEHIEAMYNSGNHFGLVYFVFVLADAVDYALPRTYSDMCATDTLVPILSAAIIEDWLDYDASSEAIEVE